MEPPASPSPSIITNGIVFAVLLLLYQVLVCIFYGSWFGYNEPIISLLAFDVQEVLLVALMTLLVIVGFGLINSYLTSAPFTGMAATLLIFALTLQNYFLMKAFWEKAGVSDRSGSNTFAASPYYNKINFINYAQNMYNGTSEWSSTRMYQPSQVYVTYSFVDAIACSLANVIAFSSVIGKIRFVQIFLLALLSSFAYQVNEQLLWRYGVYDTGYGMRIFIYGAFTGLLSKLVLGNRSLEMYRSKNTSVYTSRAFAIVGAIVCFTTFPILVAASLYQTTVNDAYILASSVLRMFLALVAGALGTVSASCICMKKILVHDFIFGALTGGILYSSSCALHENPGIPITASFTLSFIMTVVHALRLDNMSKRGYQLSQGYLDRYIVPGLGCGILSCILAGVGQGDDLPYRVRGVNNQSPSDQAGRQLIGVGLSIAFGVMAGTVIGLIYLAISKKSRTGLIQDYDLYMHEGAGPQQSESNKQY